jgi:hypothetical protein
MGRARSPGNGCAGANPIGLKMKWPLIVHGGKLSSGSPMCSGLHSAESAQLWVSPSGATAAAVIADAADDHATVDNLRVACQR